VRTIEVGRARKGNHTFVWDGKRAGRVVADGTYTITVLSRATKRGRARAASTRVVVDARYTSLGIGKAQNLSSTVVYPRTTVIHDVTVGVYNTFDSRVGDTSRIRRQVLDSSGRVLDSEPLETVRGYINSYRYTWDGRNDVGAVVAAGSYRLRLMQGRDNAGNPRVLQPLQPVTVSTQHLVARTTTISSTAQGVAHENVCLRNPEPAYDCGDHRSRSVPSTRFSDAVSYRSEQRTLDVSSRDGNYSYTIFTETTDIYSVALTGRSTPYDTFSVTAHGGPAVAGDSDVATLSAYTARHRTGVPNPPAVQMRGDTSSTLSDVHSLGLTPYRESNGNYPSVDPPLLRWYVGAADGNEYDVSWFDVTYTRYVPAS
jgi:flagellar hook assembly protein FlgD